MELNGSSTRVSPTAGKRKHQGSPTIHRPVKHLREDENDYSDAASEVDMLQSDMHLEELPLGLEALPKPVLADSAEWQRTIESVVRNVVSVRFSQTCSFDTDSAVTSEATGFVVDAEKGYILTNRHVVCAGPFWGYCVFDNHEEVRLDVP